MQGRNLPITYNKQSYKGEFSTCNSHLEEVKMKSNITSWLQILLAIASILGGAIWHIGRLSQKIDSGFDQTQKSITALTDMQKENSKKFELVAETLVKMQIESATVKEKVSQLERKKDSIEYIPVANTKKRR